MILSIEDFHTIRDMIKARSGFWLSDTKQTFLKVRLAHRLKAMGMNTARDYYYFLKYDPAGDEEMAALIDDVTVNETYFYREQMQLHDFVRDVVPAMVERNRSGRPLSIWSAGCSTGEEPYMLAMLLVEHQCLNGGGAVNILGTDINRAVLESAREGFYDDYSIRHLPSSYRLKYLKKGENGRLAVRDRVKAIVKFAHVNLMDPFETGRIRDVDCIFCRNVMIYFDDRDKGRCLDHLYRSLKMGGYLFLGHSESLGRISSLFEVKRLRQTIVYAKPEDAGSSRPA